MEEQIKADVGVVTSQKIIVDSCVLIYCGDNHHKDFSRKLLRQLSNNGNHLSISEFSGFEVIKNCQMKSVFDYYLTLIDYIENRDVDRATLIIAATLHQFYLKNLSKKEGEGCMKPGDLIVGAAAVQQKALLLTCNLSDFPEPAWKIITQTYNIYPDGRNKRALNYFLLEFDNSKLPRDLKERIHRHIVA